ncbi:hypothetical protein SGFS_045090 [Streptomyces graminofaciens]|uniref:Uncharacterized protein n=1 Tax=Streptomyces graminofaciens TaxID=68212 RepID=A0ABN5VKS3_9ACTN|nr:response regulator transcription factor [Streptomyces graminofaciens]BBC33215.1 hypothetical protein SGFS_045090 [Streptomyces graminofaciens]
MDPSVIHRAPDHRGLRVALVGERHFRLRADLHAALGLEGCIDIVVETGAYEHALPLVKASTPDVVLMDLDWASPSVLETCGALIRDAPTTRIVAMTQRCDDEGQLLTALSAGVRGYVSKSAGVAEVIGAINAVTTGAMFICQGAALLLNGLLSAPLRPAEHELLSTLTRREREILDLVARGYDNRRIARALTLADKTVRNNVSAIFGKIGVNQRAQAVVRARQAGFGLTY